MAFNFELSKMFTNNSIIYINIYIEICRFYIQTFVKLKSKGNLDFTFILKSLIKFCKMGKEL